MPEKLRLPKPGDRNGIVAFAGTYNGYREFGSFEACAKAAKARRRESLPDLRNELFFSYRASNHRGDDGVLDTYEELYPLFVKLIEQSS